MCTYLFTEFNLSFIKKFSYQPCLSMTFYCSGYPELYVKGAIIILGDTTINASELVPALTDLSSQCGTQLYRSVTLMKLKEGSVECEEYCRLKYV